MKKFLLLLLAALMGSGAILAQRHTQAGAASPDFLTQHPAVAKLYHSSQPSSNSIKTLRLQSPRIQAPEALIDAKAAALPQILGNMVGSDLWTGRYSAYGIYSFMPSDPFTFTKLATGDSQNMNANGGGVMVGDKYHAIYWTVDMFGIYAIYYIYDTNTWTLESQFELDNPGVVASDLAYDRVNDIVYGCFLRDDLTGYELAMIDYSTGLPDKESIGNVPLMIIALGVTSKGELYGICEDGVLYKFDSDTAAATKIGDTGIKVAGNNGIKQMTGEIDQHTDIFYWASNDIYGNYILYSVDIATGAVSRVADTPDRSRLLNMQIMPPAVGDEMPGYLSDCNITFTAPALTGEVSFTAPLETYAGVAITEPLTYEICVNGTVKTSGQINPGAKATATVEAMQGECIIEVYVKNQAGKSPVESRKIWVGYDMPSLLRVNYAPNGMESTITWTPSPTGVHQGYIGALTYNVVRNPDNYAVATGISSTSVVDVIPADAPSAEYSYTITPINNGVEGTPMTTEGNFIGSCSVPYTQTFDTKDSFSLFKVVDANQDGATWAWSSQYKAANCDIDYNDDAELYDVTYDDWLLTPNIHFEAGKTYKIKFRARSSGYTDKIRVALGSGTDISKYTTIQAATSVKYAAWTDFEVTYRALETQDLRVGMHRTSDITSAPMRIDDIQIVEGPADIAPAAVTNLLATAFDNGVLKANVSFVAPTVTIGGETLSDITKAEIYADNVLVSTLEDLTPGETYTQVVDVDTHAEHTFTVIAYNEAGKGPEASTKAYVGQDIPASVERVWIVDNGDSFTIKWTPVTKGAKGRYIDPSQITYSIYQTDELYYELITDNISENEFTINYNTTTGEPAAILLSVRACNAAGKSGHRLSPNFIMGEPSSLPYEEHFDGSSSYQYLGLDNNFNVGTSSTSSDGDSKVLVWVAMADTKSTKTLETMKISGDDVALYHLSFDYALGEGDKITVEALMPDGETIALGSLTKKDEDGWNNADLSLAPLAGCNYFRLKFTLEYDSELTFLMMDNLRIMQNFNRNLAATINSASSLKYGMRTDVDVKVYNFGKETSEPYTVSLYVDDELIGTASGVAIAPSKSASHNFNIAVGPWMKSTSTLKAVVDYNDDNLSDNTVVKYIDIIAPKVSAPENLVADSTSDVYLTWQTPSSFYTEERVEDFESYDPWTIAAFGDWKVVDGDKAPVATLPSATFPNEGKPQAFTIFAPQTIGIDYELNPEARPYSGDKFLACFAADVMKTERNDDWLISPILPGTAQTISFRAKGMDDFYGDEHVQLLYSSTTNNEEDFVKVTEFTIDNYDDWKEYSAEIPEGARYFALRVVTSDGFLCCIDDVTFTMGSCTDIKAYRIYRDRKMIAEVPATALSYVDREKLTKSAIYTVTAVYTSGEESAFSNEVMAASNSVMGINTGKYFPCDIFSIDGTLVRRNAESFVGLAPGVYIVNGNKVIVK